MDLWQYTITGELPDNRNLTKTVDSGKHAAESAHYMVSRCAKNIRVIVGPRHATDYETIVETKSGEVLIEPGMTQKGIITAIRAITGSLARIPLPLH